MRFLSLIILILYVQAYACDIIPNESLVSLSGPVSHFLFRLNLLNRPGIKAISSHHGLGANEFKGTLISGGLFMAPETLKSFSNSVVFFDESRELSLNLKKRQPKKIFQVSTRNLDPFETTSKIREIVTPFLWQCEQELSIERRQSENIRNEILSKTSVGNKRYVIFFLGRLEKGKRRPDLIMANDGFTMFLKKAGVIETYPTSLNYVVWSDSILKEIEKNKRPLLIGLVSEKKDATQSPLETRFEEIEKGKIYNAWIPTGIIPGHPQMEFMKDFTTFIKDVPKESK